MKNYTPLNPKQATILFRRLFTENLVGTILFESAKIAHNLALFNLIPRTDYGIMGMVFSITYLTTALADAGWTPTLPVFIRKMTESQKIIHQRLLPYLFAQIPFLVVGGIIAGLIIYQSAPSLALFAAILVITEGVRNFLRTFLHTLTINRPTILLELFATFIFMAALWIPVLLGYGAPTNDTLFSLYTITSCGAVVGLLGITFWFYKQLPSEAPSPIEHTEPTPWSWKNVFEARAATAANATLKQTMTGNFIVAALSTSLSPAALAPVKCSAYVADSIRAFLKTTVGFSGAALLAQLRAAPQEFKRKIFTTISEGYVDTIPPLLLFIIVSKHYLGGYTLATTQATLSATLVVMGILEHLFFVYEQFYIIEKNALVVATIRIAEIAVGLYVFLHAPLPTLTATTALIIILAIRIISTSSLILDGYIRYKLLPAIPSVRVIASWIVILFTILISTLLK